MSELLVVTRDGAEPAGHPADPTLWSVFERRAERCPDSVAVVDADGEYTYRYVSTKTRGLAAHLYERGALRNTLVATLCEKGVHQVVSVLGIVGSGAGYLPLDPAWPLRRTHEILARGAVKLIVLTRTQFERLEHTEIAAHYSLIVVDELPVPGERPARLPHVRAKDIAYVIFTSGSTGKPKGVVIPHEGALATITAVNDRFHVTARDSILAISRLSFDLSVYDIFGILFAGGTVVFPQEERASDPSHWLRLIERHKITFWNTVPQVMQLLVDHARTDDRGMDSLRCVMLSGDWIPLTLPDRVKERARGATVVSLGGATEGSIWSIWYVVDRVEKEWKSVPYGFAMPDQQIHVLDEEGAPCAVGITGNIYIGGKGVALGYWNDAENTEKSFPKHPQWGTLFKTGDLGCLNERGYVEFLGRRDHQIKLSGHRIELEEISAKLGLLPGVSQAVVLVKTSTNGALLAAYYVSDQPLKKADVQAFLAEQLPEYMVPRAYFNVAALPLTGNGKLDRDALLRMEDGNPSKYSPPRNELEERLCRVWARALNADRFGISDDLYHWGGDSLVAIKLAHEMTQELGQFVRPHLILLHPNVADFLQALGGEIDPGGIERLASCDAPLSFQQEASLAEELRHPGISGFPMAFEVIGDLDVGTLVKKSLCHVVREHGALRTSFESDERHVSRQVVREQDLVIDERWISEAGLERVYEGAYREPFDLRSALPIKATIYHTARATYLIVTVHTIAFDGWSIGLFVESLADAYLAYAAGESPVGTADTAIRYVDYARWQRKRFSDERLEAPLTFWREKLDGYQPFTLEQAMSGEDEESTAGACVDFALDLATSENLRRLARDQETTLFGVLLSAVYALIYAHTRQSDLAVAALAANRSQREGQHVIGNFANNGICRLTVDGSGPASSLLASVHDELLASAEYLDVPFELVLREVAPGRSRRHLLPVRLNVHDFRAHLSANRIQQRLRVISLAEHFDIARSNIEFFINPGGENVKGGVIYATSRHSRQFAAKLQEDFATILTRLPQHKDSSVDDLLGICLPGWRRV